MAARQGSRSLNEFRLFARFDVGTAGVGAEFPCPEDAVLVRIAACRNTSLTTTAAVITVAGPDGNVATTLSMPAAGAAGDVDVIDVSEKAANNRFPTDGKIQISTDGGPANTPQAMIVLTFRRV